MKNTIVLFVCCLMTAAATAQQGEVAFVPEKNIRMIGLFKEGLAWASTVNGDYGYIDTTGKMVIPPQFREVGVFSEGLALVGKPVAGNIRYGYVNRQGRLTIPCQYEDAHNFSDGRAAVKHKGSWQYIDRQGKTALGSAFVRIDTINSINGSGVHSSIKAKPLDFHNGRLLVRKGNLYGYTDTSGHWIIPPVYPWANEFSDGVAVVAGKEKIRDAIAGNDELAQMYNKLPAGRPEYIFNVIDTTGKLLFAADVEGLDDFTDGVAQFRQDDQWGLMDKKGQVVMKPRFADRPYPVSSGVFFAQINGKEEGNRDGYLEIFNTAGQPVGKVPLCLPNGHCMYNSHLAFFNGLLAVEIANKWGFVDTTGKLVIDPVYNEISDFSTHAAVRTADGILKVLRNPVK
ncbi:WG repeat-containing protein [Chitinophaga qingshengii]|uniref:WG repeat-containing protein n=1 Tax=Chitinophaga qingshengii TaxID=1569794 RepID=A0ABR7TX21_9BACT|nr:WG repeat-containing protein [Chitinophaga qingshengii]MBC9934225.1 WG repeat-containing protein [Chitinophaga qingshengii]